MRYFKLIALLMLFQLTKSQNFYIQTNNGYGIPFMKMLLGYQTDTSNITTLNYGTYGAGLNFNLGGGYLLNENLGFEIMFNYVHGKNTLTNDIKYGFIKNYRTDYARMFMLTPSFITKSNAKTINIIGKIGVVIPIGGYQITEALINPIDPMNLNPDSAIYLKVKTFGRFALGSFTSLGLEYNLLNNFSITAEAQLLLLHIKSKSSKVISYKEYGVDKYDQWDDMGNSYDIKYVDTYKEITKDTDKSSISSYSALRFNLGFKYYFGKSTSK